MKQWSFDATISALDAETSALDAETTALGAETSAIARSYRRWVSGDIGDCGVGITPQMSNRVTNHGDMSTYSKPDCWRGPQDDGKCSFYFKCYFFRTTPTNRDLREKAVYFPPQARSLCCLSMLFFLLHWLITLILLSSLHESTVLGANNPSTEEEFATLKGYFVLLRCRRLI